VRHQFAPHLQSPHAPTASPPVPVRRVGRFAEHRGSTLVRAGYGVLCRWAPALAAALAHRQLATPPRAPVGRWPLAVREHTRSWCVRSGAGDIAVYEWGHGPAVLLVHGWGSDATRMGRLVAPLVRAGCRVIAFDAPAHGRSGGERTDMVAFANAVALVARRAGPLQAVVGHSFGAAMCLYAARDWGLCAKRLVLISTFDHCDWFVGLFARHAGLTPAVLQRVRERFAQRYSGRFDWARMSVLAMGRDADRPTLLVHDRDDAEVPFEHGVALAHAMDGAQFLPTRGLGHQRVLRNPEVIRRVVAFVSNPEVVHASA
jgi:pimeloyl-ACP methyl ester carboxylesterase